jgi:phosphate transport system substrate-binding protein
MLRKINLSSISLSMDVAAVISAVIASLFTHSAAFAGTLNGAGSTFAEPAYSLWISDFQKKEKDARLNYQGVGSGAGMKQLLEGTVDFAGTDDPMKDADAAKAKAGVLHIPVAMGAVVVTYNLAVEKPLKLSGAVLAKIFNGSIKKWNDAEIAKLNPGVNLPDKGIAVATRSDGSGTTAVFTEYLAKVSPEWVGKNGKTVNWFPASLGAKGNAGVTGLVKGNPGTIGYVELIYALENKLPMAQIANKKGEYVEASAASVALAAHGIEKEASAKQFKVSITDSAEKGAYPISAFTWLLVFDKMPKEKGDALVKFAKYILSDDAQKSIAKINFAAVPKGIRADALKALGKVQLD